MPWSAEFNDACARGERITIEVEFFELAAGSSTPGTPILIEHDYLSSFRTRMRSIEPGSFRAELGGWGFTLVSSTPARFIKALERGGFIAGYGVTRSGLRERIEFGRILTTKRSQTGGLDIEVLDGFGSLQSRPSVDTVQTLGLFSDLDQNSGVTDLTANYDTSTTTMTVDDTAGFLQDSDPAVLTGALRLTPGPDGGPTLRTAWTSSTSTTFTVDPTDPITTGYPSPDEVIAQAGTKVKSLALLRGHPADIMTKILVSPSGATILSDFATYPSRWGFSLWDDLIDRGDINEHQRLVAVAAGYEWSILIENTIANPASWMSETLSPAGLAMVTRQGSLTIRAARSPWTDDYPSGYEITDNDLMEVQLSYYDDQALAVYGGVRMSGPTVSDRGTRADGNAVDTLPGVEWNERALPWAYPSKGTENDMLDETIDRLLPLLTRTPERILARCIGRRLAPLALLDSVLLTSSRLIGRREARLGGGARFDRRPCLVMGAAVEWIRAGGSVTLELNSWPEPG